MAKYNIREVSEKRADYRTLVSPTRMDVMQADIMRIIVMQKKYRDKDYSAAKLADEIGANPREVSAVVNTRFHMNYTSFVNRYRIDEARFILVDPRFLNLGMQEVSDMVGFANRQSFYGAFYKFVGVTPCDYRIQQLELHPNLVAKHRYVKKEAV